jgi:hypothetical protein
MPADFLMRSFIKVGIVSELYMNWTHEQEKDNLSNLGPLSMAYISVIITHIFYTNYISFMI